MKRIASVIVCAVLVGLPGLYQAASAQTGGPYELSWSDVGASGSSSGGVYSLDSTIGQPEAGAVSGGDYTLAGGFFASPGVLQSPVMPRVYLPLLQR